MRSRWVGIAALATLCPCLMAARCTKAQDYPVTERTLKNGMKVVVQPDQSIPEIVHWAIEKHFPLENLVFVLIEKTSAIGSAVEKYAEKRDTRAIEDPGFWPPPAGQK